jgi:hypothetical protein
METTGKPNRSTEIRYINPEVPFVERPAYRGQRYEVLAPDTLDLQEMAALAINGLTSPTDPEADYELYWWATFNSNPPLLRHAESDIVQAKHIEALPLLRTVCGSDLNPQVEQRWMEVIRQMQGPDGLLYLPKVGRPWCVFGNYGKEPPGDHYFSPWFDGRLLGTMTIYSLLTGDAGWQEAGRRVVDGLHRLAVHEGEKAHFAWHEFGTEGQFTPGNPADAVHNPATYHAWAIQGLANYYRHTGYPPALELAARLSRWVREDSHHFAEDGRFLEEYPGVRHVHFHGHTMVLLALLDCGVIAGDPEAVGFARRGFEYGLTQGECLLGYFQEWLNVDRPQTLEVCELADMLALAVKLSLCGAGDYWDLADRWTRNLFAESQLRRAEWVYWLAEKSAPSVVPPYHTAERAVERNLGAFGGWLAPNDFLPERFPHDRQMRDVGIMHCCTGNGARTIYYVWENVLTYQDGTLRVNLLLNRASRWADVDSHLPYTGQVDVKVKEPVELSLRLPEGVRWEESTCTVNGQAVGNGRRADFGFRISDFGFRNGSRTVPVTSGVGGDGGLARRPAPTVPDYEPDGRYVQVGPVEAGDVVTLRFPLRERSERIHVERRTYRVLLRGNTCVAIDPPGVNCPLFQRDHYREDGTRWRRIERFVADKWVEW